MTMGQPIENKSKWATNLIEESGIEEYVDSRLHSDFAKPKPDFTCTDEGYGIVIAYKKDVKRQLKLNRGKVSMTETNTLGYAVNKACKCAENILKSKGCPLSEIFAIGMSGNEEKHLITSVLVNKPRYINGNGEEPAITIGIPKEVENLQNFAPQSIREYALHIRLGAYEERHAPERYARKFREELKKYTNFTESEMLLAGTGLLLAALGAEGKNKPLQGSIKDGETLIDWLKNALNLPKEENFVYSFFEILKARVLNESSPLIPKSSTPAQYLIGFLEKNVIPLRERKDDELNIFYKAFKRSLELRSYLATTPEFVTSLFYDILAITPSDRVLDALCGGGSLMASIAKRMKESEKGSCGGRVMGVENPMGQQMAGLAEATFKLAGTEDCCRVLKGSLKDFKEEANIGILCPSYEVVRSEEAFNNLETSKELLGKIEPGGKVICVLPQSSLTTRNNQDMQLKKDILSQNTLEGVITLERRIGIFPCLAIFTAGIPQPKGKNSKFITCSLEMQNSEMAGRESFRGGFRPSETQVELEELKRKEILDLWRSEKGQNSGSFLTEEPKPEDEWLHSFYYFNTDIPTKEDFEKTVSDYLSFQFSMIMQGRGYLFDD